MNTANSIIATISASKTRAMTVTELACALGTDRDEVKATVAQLVQAGRLAVNLIGVLIGLSSDG